ncbi:MAG: 4-alpha-glucanotransferase [Gemmatimonadetes bacterium]|nr:4-alpha-glucanotransferase [Gemmatimonadota bacterium]
MEGSLHALAEEAGIVSRYLDQTGTEWREASDETRIALLHAMGIDASTEAAARESLAALHQERANEVVAPVQVLHEADANRRLVRANADRDEQGGIWTLELTLEDGDTHHASGDLPPGRQPLELTLPVTPGLGYHRVTVTTETWRGIRRGVQLRIVVPASAVSPVDKLWIDARPPRAFGVIANLYTVRSAWNWGSGDFEDLARLAAWTGARGGDFLGVNPLHALMNRDAMISPYSPVSRIFRNVLYVAVDQVPELSHAPELKAELRRPPFSTEREALRAATMLDYGRVMALKLPVLERLHGVFRARERVAPGGVDRMRAYQRFVASRDPELTRFATWMTIAEVHGADWREWPEGLRSAESPDVEEWRQHREDRVDFHRWLQFELDRQLGDAADAARAAGMRIGLYQDLAVGTAPGGFDSWMYPGLFLDGAQVGAPPDPYSDNGQDWGLPPLDPRALRRDAYRYWVQLLRSAFRHAGALRIDHVLGLFRLFWIPRGRTGRDGAYVRMPMDDLFGILALESHRANAVVVGEDLGTVPEEVPAALARWGVLSSKVLYFERHADGEYRRSEDYPALALATVNTHDLATIAGFWSGHDLEVRERVGLTTHVEQLAQARVERERERGAMCRLLGITEEQASDSVLLRARIHEVLAESPAVLVGVSLDDLAGELEPVNVPGVGPEVHPSWQRRMTRSLEELFDAGDVARLIRIRR